MKKWYKIVFSTLLIVMILVVSIKANVNTAGVEEKVDSDKISLEDYPKNSRERYVAGLALEKNISYENADILEKQQSGQIVMNEYDEELRYKTVDKRAGKVVDGNDYNQDVYISAEVRYIWNIATDSLTIIEDVVGAYLYLPGILSESLYADGGEIVEELHPDRARISQTVNLEYNAEGKGIDITVGGDVLSVSRSFGDCTIATRVKTYAINIAEENLN